MNDGARMNPRREFYRGGREPDDNLFECLRRILYSNGSSADLLGEIRRNNDSGSASLAQLRKVARIIEKRDFVGGGFGQRSCTDNFHVGIPLQFSAAQLCDFFQSKRHNSLLNWRGTCAKRKSDILPDSAEGHFVLFCNCRQAWKCVGRDSQDGYLPADFLIPSPHEHGRLGIRRVENALNRFVERSIELSVRLL